VLSLTDMPVLLYVHYDRNTFIQQGQMKLIKSDSKGFYMVRILNKCCFFSFLFFK